MIQRYKWYVFGIIAVALLVASFALGYGSGKDKVQARWDKSVADGLKIIEADRAYKQKVADAIAKQAQDALQRQLEDNTRLAEELANERNKDPVYRTCVIPANGVQLYRKATSTTRKR